MFDFSQEKVAMRRKILNERQLRVLDSMRLLASFWQRRLPAESTSPTRSNSSSRWRLPAS